MLNALKRALHPRCLSNNELNTYRLFCEFLWSLKLVGSGLNLVCSLAIRGSLGVFFCSGISVVLIYTLWFSGCHNTFLSSHHL